MMGILTSALALASPATPFAGMDWEPLGRSDVVWASEERGSGVLVGPFDGFADPSLTAYGGVWWSPHWAVESSLGVARLQNTVFLDDTWTQQHWGVVRPALALRWSWVEARLDRPHPWLRAGSFGSIPSVRQTSNAFTRKEQKTADALAETERSRLSGLGLQLGAGVTYPLAPGLHLGGRYQLEYYRSLAVENEGDAITSWLHGSAAILLEFQGNVPNPPPHDAPQDPPEAE